MNQVGPAETQPTHWFARSFGNWRLALVLTVCLIPVSIWLLPVEVAFWVSLVAVLLAISTLVVHAWGRHYGGLLVAPALGLLFVVNIFPLMWSFGLSFFHYRANRMYHLALLCLQPTVFHLDDEKLF